MFGVFGMCLSCIFIGIFPCVLSVILGCIALKDDMSYKWPSICGIVCSAIGIIMFVVMVSQTNEYKSANVATPTEVVQNITNSDDSVTNNSDIAQSNDSTQRKTSQTSSQTETKDKDIFFVGETAELNNVQVTMTDYSESYGSEFNYPAEGNAFVLVEFEIVNNSNSDLAISSMLSFSAYADDYALDYSLGALMEKGSSNQLDGTIAAGKRMKGVIGWEVPADWKTIEIHFTDNVWSNNKFKFEIDK